MSLATVANALASIGASYASLPNWYASQGYGQARITNNLALIACYEPVGVDPNSNADRGRDNLTDTDSKGSDIPGIVVRAISGLALLCAVVYLPYVTYKARLDCSQEVMEGFTRYSRHGRGP